MADVVVAEVVDAAVRQGRCERLMVQSGWRRTAEKIIPRRAASRRRRAVAGAGSRHAAGAARAREPYTVCTDATPHETATR